MKDVRGMVNVCLFAVLHRLFLMHSSAEEFSTVITYTGITKKLFGTVKLQIDCFVSELIISSTEHAKP